MSFQLSILKILAGQPNGSASLDVIKQHLAVFYTSGPEWAARMKRLASAAPDLDLFGQGLITREKGLWTLTTEGRAFLERLERQVSAADRAGPIPYALSPQAPVEIPPAAISPLRVEVIRAPPTTRLDRASLAPLRATSRGKRRSKPRNNKRPY